jgi:hypothetical protein
MELNVRKFDIKSIKNDSTVVLLGKRNTGKSFLIRDILYHNRDIPMGMVMSQTDHLNHYYDQFIPPILIHKKYDSGSLSNLFKRQMKAIQEKWADPSAFLLIDDCLSDAKTWGKDPNIKEIFFNGRWYKIFFILAMQAPMGIPPALRTNIDFTFILKNNNAADRERIYKNYAGVFSSRRQFETVLDACTEDYNALVINNTTMSNKLEDQVFYYKAQDHGDFRICSDSIWRKNDQVQQQKINLRENHKEHKNIVMH